MLPLTVVVLAWNGAGYLEACLASVLAQDYAPLEVIVVDNGSTDDSALIAERYAPPVRLLRAGRNLGYAAGNNLGLAAATGQVVVLLNQDTVLQPGCLAALAGTFSDPQVGLVGCKLYYPGGRTLAHAGAAVRPGDGFTLHLGQNEVDTGQYDTLAPADFVTGAALAIHRRVLDRLGPLDEGYFPAYYEDIDYCYRARRAGFLVLYQPRAVVVHHESTSTASRPYARSAAFHRHRLRFVLSHWSPGEWEALVAAEHQAIASTLWVDDAVARARAYLESLLALPELGRRRASDPTLGGSVEPRQVTWMARELAALRQFALDRVRVLIEADGAARLAPPAPDGLARAAAAGDHLAALEQRLAALQAAVVLREHPFTSSVPRFGPFIVGFRRLWNAIATRWYVLPVLEQQTAINQNLAQGLVEVAQALRAEMAALAVDSTLWRLLAADQASLAQALGPRSTDEDPTQPRR